MYTVPETTSLSAWLVDFDKRTRQLHTITETHHYNRIWMGGLFNPEAYMTATRQASARAHGWSLEKLVLNAEVLTAGEGEGDDSTSFVVVGLSLEAAAWSSERSCVEASDQMCVQLDPIRFTWCNSDGGAESHEVPHGQCKIPVYLNETRLEFLFSVLLARDDAIPSRGVYQRGVALLSTRLG